jgi:acyl-coenzyme A synthetase/AMP-(fatty) acid ligase
MFMLPGHVEVVADLPRNPNGKIDRKSLSIQFAKVFTGPEEPV